MIWESFVGLFLLCYFVELAGHCGCLIASMASPAGSPGDSRGLETQKPFFIVVIPCRDGSASLPGIVHCLRRQQYPADRFRIIVLADNCSDGSTDVARSLGVEVYERNSSEIKTKGAAVDELLKNRLKKEEFNALLIFDVDARVGSDFLAQSASHWSRGDAIVQSEIIPNYTGSSTVEKLADISQLLTRLYERGRAVLGWNGLVIGSSLMLSRACLVRLDWQLSTGKYLSLDMALNFRSCLRSLPITYAIDQKVSIDLPATERAYGSQRRRWTAGRLEVVPLYFWPLLKAALRGDWRALDMLLYVLLMPPMSMLFSLAGVMTVVLCLAGLKFHSIRWITWALGSLWLIHGASYFGAFLKSGHAFGWSDLKGTVVFLWIRLKALLEGVALGFRDKSANRWEPMSHEKDDARKVGGTA